MRNLLNDMCRKNGSIYDIVFVDIPYNGSYKNRDLEIKMERYRQECENIVSWVTGKEYKEKQIYYSMGILCLSAYLKAHIEGIRVGYIHYYLNYDLFEVMVRNTKVIAFSTMTVTMPLISFLIEKAKRINPDVIVVLGGYHVSFYAKEVLQENPHVDYIILKEGEKSLLALFEESNVELIEGISYRSANGKIQVNEFKNYLNSEDIPTPDYSLIEKYLSSMNIQLSTMRGCIGKCKFCVNHNYWKFPRLREIDRVIEELQYLKTMLPKGTVIHIIDNIFTLSEKHLEVLLQKMIENEVLEYFYFECDTLCSCINVRKINLLKKIGIIKVCLGIEDSEDRILGISNKRVRYADNLKAAKLIKETAPDICVYAYWIIGLPGTTKNSIQSNLFAMKNILEKGIVDIISPKIFIPYPGSFFYENAVKNGIYDILKQWNLYERREPPYPYKYKDLSQKDLYNCLLEALNICHVEYEKILEGK